MRRETNQNNKPNEGTQKYYQQDDTSLLIVVNL